MNQPSDAGQPQSIQPQSIQRQSIQRQSIQAAIDLGTNTILMVTGRPLADGTVDILDDAHEIARLGKGVDASRRILPATMQRVCGLLAKYRERAEELGAERVLAFGTSALRDAVNKSEFIAAAASEAGVSLIELSGNDEARYTFAGAAFGLRLPDSPYAVLDIGGGSTELACGQTGTVERSQSVDVGAVRVTERCFPQLPPTPGQLENARTMIGTRLDELFPLPADQPVVGVAGTVTTIGALDAGAARFDSRDIDGYYLSRDAIISWSERLLHLTHDDIRALPQVNEQRADIIGAGSLILRSFMESRDLPGITVSTRGIRYGLLLDMLAGQL
jgi:exopolyphosphatase / guanosine-5'-triphosphate,3'-diphosphate pyrophosphatase